MELPSPDSALPLVSVIDPPCYLPVLFKLWCVSHHNNGVFRTWGFVIIMSSILKSLEQDHWISTFLPTVIQSNTPFQLPRFRPVLSRSFHYGPLSRGLFTSGSLLGPLGHCCCCCCCCCPMAAFAGIFPSAILSCPWFCTSPGLLFILGLLNAPPLFLPILKPPPPISGTVSGAWLGSLFLTAPVFE